MRLLVLLCAGLLAAMAGPAFALAESEINNDAPSANGPFTFPDSITGNLQADGAPVTPTDFFKFTTVAGTSYKFSGSVTGGSLGADLGLDIENSSGSILVLADANNAGGSETLTWIAPSNGTFYLVVFEATGTPNDISTYTINASITSGPTDTTPPTWAMGSAGVLSAIRLAGNTSANVSWFQASDNATPPGLIVYEIYYSTAPGTVFSSGIKATQTGSLSQTVTGLVAESIYYFGVRARDAANNRDANTQIVESDPVRSAAWSAWALYE